MKPGNVRPAAPVLGLLALAGSLAFTGCEDGLEPAVWGNFPDTVDLYSLSRAEYVNEFGAYDFLNWPGRAVIVEADPAGAFAFDIAVAEDEEGAVVFLPTGFFPDASARPGILADDTATFDGLRRAPSDGYEVEEPVTATTEVVYVVRSRQDGRGCRRYAKMEVLSIGADGVVKIRALVNRNCNDRSLIPNAPEEEPEEEEDGEGGG